jgi:putative transposase
MQAVSALGLVAGRAAACRALGVARASFYRYLKPVRAAQPRPAPARKLSAAERQEILDTLHAPRFVDRSPRQVWAALLDEGRYLGSVRTMYRLLAEAAETQERRNQLRHPVYRKPELLATGPNQVWSWDITKLRGPQKWTTYALYVILDIFSRHTVGWLIAGRESAELARRLIEETCRKQGIEEGELTIHADRGPAMKSQTVAQLMAVLGVTKSHSRPHVSNDNPFSEAQFKTLKYHPAFPDRFGSLEDARAFCASFFRWYNQEHYHSGIGLMTPETVHYGLAAQVVQRRQAVLEEAYRRTPERFVRRCPRAPQAPGAVWINPPELGSTAFAQ